MVVTEPGVPPAEEVIGLRRCMRDVIALTALPAIWGDIGPQQVADSLADVLVRTVGLDLVLIRVQGGPGEATYDVARSVIQGSCSPDQVRALAEALAAHSTAAGADSTRTIADPLGDGMLRVVTVPIGLGGDCGSLVACARNPGFPTETDRLLVSVAANQ